MKPTLESTTPSPENQNRRPEAPGAAQGLRRQFDLRNKDAAPCTTARLLGGLGTIALCASLTGCLGFLEPARPIARHFVLTPAPVTTPVTTKHGSLVVGVGPVRIAPYLFSTSLAVRKGTNEIDYLPWALWAERLDKGIQHTLAENLSTLLTTNQVRLSAWRSSDVSAELYVGIGQFDVDAAGRGVLVGWWRIQSPGGEKTLKAGESRFVREGPSPDADLPGAVATLSELITDLSRQLAQAIAETGPAVK